MWDSGSLIQFVPKLSFVIKCNEQSDQYEQPMQDQAGDSVSSGLVSHFVTWLRTTWGHRDNLLLLFVLRIQQGGLCPLLFRGISSPSTWRKAETCLSGIALVSALTVLDLLLVKVQLSDNVVLQQCNWKYYPTIENKNPQNVHYGNSEVKIPLQSIPTHTPPTHNECPVCAKKILLGETRISVSVSMQRYFGSRPI